MLLKKDEQNESDKLNDTMFHQLCLETLTSSLVQRLNLNQSSTWSFLKFQKWSSTSTITSKHCMSLLEIKMNHETSNQQTSKVSKPPLWSKKRNFSVCTWVCTFPATQWMNMVTRGKTSQILQIGWQQNWKRDKRFYHKINHFKLLQWNNEFNYLI